MGVSAAAALEEGFGMPGFDQATARVFSKEVEMAQTKTEVAHKPVWLDLSSPDPEGSREFYSKLFGWNIEVNPDPQYGGDGVGRRAGEGVGGGGGGGVGGDRPPAPRDILI